MRRLVRENACMYDWSYKRTTVVRNNNLPIIGKI